MPKQSDQVKKQLQILSEMRGIWEQLFPPQEGQGPDGFQTVHQSGAVDMFVAFERRFKGLAGGSRGALKKWFEDFTTNLDAWAKRGNLWDGKGRKKWDQVRTLRERLGRTL